VNGNVSSIDRIALGLLYKNKNATTSLYQTTEALEPLPKGYVEWPSEGLTCPPPLERLKDGEAQPMLDKT